ncbi:MAG: CHAD domain-containing protein [Phycisphaerales bacterium]|nr:MAG: CHAD domain-containing protein [Phycisphaerales bacterium]
MPVTEAAERVLSIRLDAVCDLLPIAQETFRDDPKAAHRLRVATRRCEAGLMVFRPCLKRKQYRKMRKHLRRIRRAAGAARVCDVHAGLFADRLDRDVSKNRAALEYVLKRTLDERGEAQQEIDDVAHRYRGTRLRKRAAKLLKSIREPDSEEISASGQPTTLLDLARTELTRLIDRVQEAGQADLQIVDNLHELRIRIKRLRYGMEVFAPCFDDRFGNELYNRVESLQEHLGELNDTSEIIAQIDWYAEELATGSKTARSSLDGKSKGAATKMLAELDSLRTQYDRELNKTVKEFGSWFSDFPLGELVEALRGSLENGHSDQTQGTTSSNGVSAAPQSDEAVSSSTSSRDVAS